MITLDKVTERIVSLTTESQDQTITGGKLSGLLRHYYPDFEPARYHSKNLRAFIRTNLPDKLQEAGISGTDIIYKLRGPEPPTSPESTGSQETEFIPNEPVQLQSVKVHHTSSITRRINHDAFRAFKSPNSPLQLYANTQTGSLTLGLPGSDLREPWVHIPPCSSETHFRIAKDFVESLPEEASKAPLARILNTHTKAWWIQFWPMVRSLRVDGRWLSFKRERLLQEFEATLQGHGVPIADDSALREAAEDQTRITKTVEHREVHTVNPEEVRKAILRVVAELPLAELRNLRLPAGEVIDAISKHL
jgi:hypothetical protein